MMIFKVIYGVEGYLVDDTEGAGRKFQGTELLHDTYVVFDIETTGFQPCQQ